jgi:hypothetical protein
MSTARITVLVTEESVLGRHAFVSRSGEMRGWLEIGQRGELVLCGSPVALRRLAVAVRDAAKSAEKRNTRCERLDDDRPAAA